MPKAMRGNNVFGMENLGECCPLSVGWLVVAVLERKQGDICWGNGVPTPWLLTRPDANTMFGVLASASVLLCAPL